jgi:CubicO group peptidase (beta-lactamase class C family)
MLRARFVVVALVLVACAAAQDRDARLQEAYARLDQFAVREMRAHSTPGISLALTDRNGLLHTATYGYADVKLKKPVTPDTLFEIGSISKSFTAITLLQLTQEGKFDPRQPIKNYLPWFSIHSYYPPITGHAILTHTAGLPRDRDDIPSALYQAAAVRDRNAAYEGGRHFAYSNVGYQILGYAVEEITGHPNADEVKRRILEPLGMTHSEPRFTHDTYAKLATGYAPLYDDRPVRPGAPLIEATWIEYAAGDGAIVSTAADMAVYLRMLLNRGQGPNWRILSDASFALLTQRAVKETASGDTYYGYGIDNRTVDGHTYIGHTGGMIGYSSRIEGDLDLGVGVTALYNSPLGAGRVVKYALQLLRAVYENKPLPPLPEEDSPLVVKNATDYVGTYTSPEARKLVITAEGDKLLLACDGHRFALQRNGEDSFLVDYPDFQLFPLRFGREQGRVVEVFYGSDWYANERYQGPRSFDVPAEWFAFPGHYRANHAWFNNFRIVLRKGKLWLLTPGGDEEYVLTPGDDGVFWAGEEGRFPREQISFDTSIRGGTQRAVLSGLAYYRTFTP